MNILITLFLEFFKIGLFSVGGGLATLPYLAELTEKYTWFTMSELIDMVAISESTPGAIGINMATFVGYRTAGIAGGILASVAIVAPAILIVVLIARMLEKFRNNKYVEFVFYGLRAAVAALVLSAGWSIAKITLFHLENPALIERFNWPALALFLLVFVLIRKYKKHPIVYLAACAVVGLVIPF
ncbi:MAG: chromate transporter [Erysipelotrichaceae bacterium]|jgi:chromate transporter|nr:chromate transporter [Erysipelotrichaceae bacterium]